MASPLDLGGWKCFGERLRSSRAEGPRAGEAGVQEKCGIVQFGSNGCEAKEGAGTKSQKAWKVMSGVQTVIVRWERTPKGV